MVAVQEAGGDRVMSVGGLAGSNNGSISDSFAAATVLMRLSGVHDSGVNAGGFTGFNTGTISDSFSIGAVVGPEEYTLSGFANGGTVVDWLINDGHYAGGNVLSTSGANGFNVTHTT